MVKSYRAPSGTDQDPLLKMCEKKKKKNNTYNF